ncbi:ABC transporter permease subunit [Candidatus Sumerlaeota bacterium]|nr:ABC transporter permease subunit [Candidatus Sumerlaeota bacterium]
MNFLTLLRVEWIKTMRMMSTYIAFAAAGCLVMLIHTGVYFTSNRSGEYRWLQEHGFDTSLLVNSYITTRMVMEIGFRLLLAPMVIQIFARQVAGEDLRGTLRLILSRPISRMALINAKFLVCTAYCLLLMGFTLALSYGVGLILYGPHKAITIGSFRQMESRQYADRAKSIFDDEKNNGPKGDGPKLDEDARKYIQEKYKAELSSRGAAAFSDRNLMRRMSEDYMGYTLSKNVIDNGECMKRLAIAWILTSWALLTIGSISLLFSVLNKHPISAMALTVGTYFMVAIVQGLASADNIMQLFKAVKPYLFTTAMDYYQESMSLTIDWMKIRDDAALLGSYTLVFFIISQFIFWRKDITS